MSLDSRASKADRFRILRTLGAGGMGIVYQAEDLERQAVVALKTLPKLESSSLYQFKREFRSLAGISHPNLVTLYELFAQNDEWFITMEYIEGVNFLEAIQPTQLLIPTGQDQATLTVPLDAVGSGSGLAPGNGAPCDHSKMRAILAQVAEGLDAIHSAGKLHCDIKPSNVLVTPEQRAIILDFGLVAELHSAIGRHDAKHLRGTIAYMSPEQSERRSVTPASDWYSLGVMMFRALTGRLPFQGTPAEILDAKRSQPAPRVSSIVTTIPKDLDRLCEGLLEWDPARRPNAVEVLRVLQGEAYARPAAAETRGEFFVGRETELGQLHAALQSIAVGRPAIALIEGPSGVGKSALTTRFLQSIEASGALVFAGRCYEHEAVPFRAMDSVIDSLGNYLSALAPSELDSIRPSDAGTLAKAFPVLRRLKGFELEPGDAFDTRRRAFRALRDLLSRMAVRDSLVIAIDDLQWGDADSAALLNEVLRQPGAPGLMLVASFRRGADQNGEFVPALLESCATHGIQFVRVPVEPLTLEESRQFAERLMAQSGDLAHESAEAIARESSGNPFFIRELSHHAAAGMAINELPALDRLLSNRVSQLPAPARQLLEVVAIAGRRITQLDAFHAAGLKGLDPQIAVLLRSTNLVKGTGGGPADFIEPYHDRVRESVVAWLDPDKARSHHLNLAVTLLASGRSDDEMLAFQFERGGELLKAGRHYVAAAARARGVTAFDRAAAQYGRAVELLASEPDIHSLRVTWAEALALAGRSYDAAVVYSRAAGETSGSQATALSREAGYHYLASGHIDEGRDVFRQLLAGSSEALPKSELGSILRFLYYRVRLQLRGVEFRRRPPEQAPAGVIERADATYAVGTGLGMVDLARAMAPLQQSLLLSLKAGDAMRVQRALAMHAPGSTTADPPFGKFTLNLLSNADRLAVEVDTPLARGLAALGRAGAMYAWCRWPQALPVAEEAERILAKECQGVAWELDTIRTFILFTLSHLGRWSELSSRGYHLLEEAEQRGNLYMAVNLGVYLLPSAIMLLQGIEASRKITAAYSRRWTQEGFHLQHVMSTNLMVLADLAEGKPKLARDRLEEAWPYFLRAQMHRYPNLRIYWWDMRARSALAVALTEADPGPHLRLARKYARSLVKERYPHGPAFGKMLLAAIADQHGETSKAIELMHDSLRRFEEAGMASHAAATKLRLAQLCGGDHGDRLRSEVTAWAEQEGIPDLENLLRLHTSGFRASGA
jgi:eukaryotic-like serine/threonine-protein kinase